MPHDARAVANLILSEWDARSHRITNKKINKLIYFSHGYCLARLRSPLITNHIEAWDHGPVIRVVYDAFKKFGFQPITELAMYFDYKEGTEVVARATMRDPELHLLRRTAGSLLHLSGDELEDMTHGPGSPWTRVWASGRRFMNRIPDDLIATHFAARYDLNRNHS